MSVGPRSRARLPLAVSAGEAERRFRTRFKTLGSDPIAATHTFSITALFDTQQRPVHGNNLAADQRGLSFEGLIVFQFHRLLGQVTVEGFGQLQGDPLLPLLKFRELLFQTSSSCIGIRPTRPNSPN